MSASHINLHLCEKTCQLLGRKSAWWRDECQTVCAACTFSLFVCVWVRVRHFSSLMSQVPQGNAGNVSWQWVMATVCQRKRAMEGDGSREGDASRLHQLLISTVTPQEKDFPLWIIFHCNSLINQFMPWCLGNLGWYLFSMWAVHASLSYESQKREEGRREDI